MRKRSRQAFFQVFFGYFLAAVAGLFVVFGEILVALQFFDRSFTSIALITVFLLLTSAIMFQVVTTGLFPRGSDPVFVGLVVTSSAVLVGQWGGLFFSEVSPKGYQGLLGFTTFLLAIYFGGLLPYNTARHATTMLVVSGLIISTALHVEFFLTLETVGTRHTSMMILVPLTLLAMTDFQRPILSSLSTLFVLSAALLQESRGVAIAILVVLLCSVFLRDNRPITQKLVVGLGGVCIALVHVFTSSGLLERFLRQGDSALAVKLPGSISELSRSGLDNPAPLVEPNEITIDTNGRLQVWTSLLEQLAGTDWVWGRGLGYSRDYVAVRFGWDHPHNELVRFLVDFGILGVVGTTLIVILMSIVAWRSKVATNGQSFGLNLALILGLLTISIFDGPLMSLGVLLAYGLAIGFTISQPGDGYSRKSTTTHPGSEVLPNESQNPRKGPRDKSVR